MSIGPIDFNVMVDKMMKHQEEFGEDPGLIRYSNMLYLKSAYEAGYAYGQSRQAKPAHNCLFDEGC